MGEDRPGAEHQRTTFKDDEPSYETNWSETLKLCSGCGVVSHPYLWCEDCVPYRINRGPWRNRW